MTIEQDNNQTGRILTAEAASIYTDALEAKFQQGFLTELQTYPNFVVWQYALVGGQRKKPPFDPKTGRAASTNRDTTWGTLEQALSALRSGRYQGLGFVFTNTPLTGVDLDHCIAEDGTMAGWASQIIDDLATYTEYSPSGTGVHLLTEAAIPGAGKKSRKAGNIEIYAEERYFTLTTNHIPETPLLIAQRQEAVTALYQSLTPTPRENTSGGGMRFHREVYALSRSDEDVLAKALGAANGAQFRELFEGGWQANARYSREGKPDQSRADFQLVKYLLYWTNGDTGQVDRLFRRSCLMRDKWDDSTNSGGGGHTYGEVTIWKARK